jgi:hypothetical protein
MQWGQRWGLTVRRAGTASAISGSSDDAAVGARHHHLPHFHLERFADERLHIARVDRCTGERRITAIKDTAAEKDFRANLCLFLAFQQVRGKLGPGGSRGAG